MCIVSHRHKFIFLRPRKIAGMSLQVSLSRVLGEHDVAYLDRPLRFIASRDDHRFRVIDAGATVYGGGHLLPDTVRKTVGERVWSTYFKFTAVRNPYDILVSFLYFKFSSRYWRDIWWGRRRPRALVRNAPRALRLHRLRRRFRGGRGREAVEAILRERLFDQIEDIPRFYFSRGAPYADYVIRFENLQQDYDALCERLGLPPQTLSRINTKPKPRNVDYRDYYTDWSKGYIADLCRPMLDDFGYRFEDGPSRRR